MSWGRVHVHKRPPVAVRGSSHRSDDRGFIVNSRRWSSWFHAFTAALKLLRLTIDFQSDPPYFPEPPLLLLLLILVFWKWRHVPVSVRLPFHGAQLAALRSRRKLPNPGEEQQTLVAGVPLQLGGNRLHSSLLYRKNKGKPSIMTPLLWAQAASTSPLGSVDKPRGIVVTLKTEMMWSGETDPV